MVTQDDSNAIPQPTQDLAAHAARKRPLAGERRLQILQTLAAMLEKPGTERVTTAALAAKIDVSEAALYRHFASKAQMFEGLIDFIEQSIFGLINQVNTREPDPMQQAARIVSLVLHFADKNPGMARVMVGDALVNEHERLLARMNSLFDKIEASLRQCLRKAALASGSAAPTVDANVRAAVLCAFVAGRVQRFARSDFRRPASELLEPALSLMLR